MDNDDHDAPRDENGHPICARPCRDGLPCYRQVPLPGIACQEHDDGQPTLPLPDPVPTYSIRDDCDGAETTINEE